MKPPPTRRYNLCSMMIIILLMITSYHHTEAISKPPLFSTNSRHLSSTTFDSSSIITLPIISHHEVIRRRRRQLGTTSSNEAVVAAAAFQSAGQHFVDLWVGTPPQLRTVVLDTGSYQTASICDGCQDCGKSPNPAFYPNRSKSFRKLTCGECFTGYCTNITQQQQCYSFQGYVDGSNWTGFDAIDQSFLSNDATSFASSSALSPLSASNTSAFQLNFVCQQSLVGNINYYTTDGVMAMAFAVGGFWYQLFLANITQSPTFSICYARSQNLTFAAETLYPNNNNNNTVSFPNKGVLTLGGTDARLHDSPMVYSSNATNGYDIFFRVVIRQVYLGYNNNNSSGSENAIPLFNTTTDDLNIEPFGTILDTGTAISTFPRFWYDVFNRGWLDQVGAFFDPYLSFEVSAMNDIIRHFPTFYFQLMGADDQDPNITNDGGLLAASFDKDHPLDIIIEFPPQKYIQLLGTLPGSSTLLYGPQFGFSDENRTILGANFITGNDVFIDYLSNRIGWAKSDCSYARVGPPTAAPSATPSSAPSDTPSSAPSETPSSTPSHTPSSTPSSTPSHTPSSTPSSMPSSTPSSMPSSTPSSLPSSSPSSKLSKKGKGSRKKKSKSSTINKKSKINNDHYYDNGLSGGPKGKGIQTSSWKHPKLTSSSSIHKIVSINKEPKIVKNGPRGPSNKKGIKSGKGDPKSVSDGRGTGMMMDKMMMMMM